MSRIGKMPIPLSNQAKIEIKDSNIRVSGPKGTLEQRLTDQVTVSEENGLVTVLRIDDSKKAKAQHGLYRMLISNMVDGVTKGFTRKLEIAGVGYRAELKNDLLALTLGYSHMIYFKAPDEIKIEVPDQVTVLVSGIDKALVGQVAAKIRSFRKPEPYRGKGIKYEGEVIRRKEGKAAGK
ncbi:50S ribosomal protein L6 [Pelodictyon phaeoclathratiforme]|jgi:large subunit ribosomal protein L6|uniref:Large ribosomal subunit protein uL6 n=1 Tax=Pelodictyon phaeoclathratiforme (strain DSM 5477 / BU-1) TaxID=324925 RepID=RL6_PELPB|nr:50S ribosomal protein L6 [Pelodictyon phaeoclathratiforme]B4SBW2.1 RecName: Full=Large ribosomal subunit protein uL6; AltName: Full=50S ribosomal protein L6 [Pelodictyon phaeoclathratiforme BU-1]ACF42637.1 ribosomal protein L6 [Pelodictyon phaeoclathratiforme BU-1]MBV5289492.1 50S ribosomal protein L6 [Pelodictyon phaeoclathratiforme]